MSNISCVCLPRLVVRTSGFHPDNMGSIPVGDAKGAVLEVINRLQKGRSFLC